MRSLPWGDLLTAFDGNAITYDEIGNPLSDATRTFTWEHGRQMATQTKSGVEWEYTYDANGMRTSRSSDSKTYDYVYSGDKLVQMTITDHTTSPETVQLVELSYDAAGQPLTMELDGTMYYYVLNIQGDVMGLVDGGGNLMLSLIYEGYGEGFFINNTSDMVTTLASTNPLGYRGYVLDMGTGIYYLQSRYYDPDIGRFLNADILTTTGQGLLGNNMFAYCGNNPVMRTDDGGEFWHIVIGAAVGAVIGAVVTGVQTYLSEGSVNWAKVGISALAGAAGGALAATGVGAVGMIAGSAAISMAENAATQVVDNKGFDNFDVVDMLVDGAIGGVSGAIAGAGSGSKHLTKLGVQTVKRTAKATAHNGVKAGIKEAGKAFAYYGKNTSKYYIKYMKHIAVDIISVVGENVAKSNYMKYQYQNILSWK